MFGRLYDSGGGGDVRLWGRLCDSGGWCLMVLRNGGFWLKDKEDSCHWWSIGEEQGIARCDRDKLEALTRKFGSMFWYQCGIMQTRDG